MMRYSIEPRTRKYVKRYGFLSFARNFCNKYRRQLLDTKLDALKTATQNVVDKADEAAGEFVGNKIADKIMKTKYVIDENARSAEKIIIPPEKIEEILNELRQVL